jgi:hypothetical protein
VEVEKAERLKGAERAKALKDVEARSQIFRDDLNKFSKSTGSEALRKELAQDLAPNEGGKPLTKDQVRSLNEAHATGKPGPDGKWSKADLRAKYDILEKGGWSPDQIKKLQRMGLAGEGIDVPKATNKLASTPGLDDALKADKRVTPKMYRDIKASPTAQRQFAALIEDGKVKNPAEWERTMRSASRASSLSRTIATVGVGADVFGFVMAYLAYEELGKRIEACQNPAMKDVLQGMQFEKKVEMGVNVVTFGVNAAALVLSPASGSILAVCSVATLPLALGVVATTLVTKHLYALAATWSKDYKEWAAELDATGLQAKLVELGQGNADFWDSAVVSDWSLSEFYKNAETANEQARVALMQAYFFRTMPFSMLENETEEQALKRYDLAVSDAMRYMVMRAREVVNGENLENAILHAQLCARARELKKAQAQPGYEEESDAEYLTYKDASGVEQKFDVSRYNDDVALSSRAAPGRLNAGILVNAYKGELNENLANYANGSKASIEAAKTGIPGVGMDSLKMAQGTIQSEILTRLEPYLYRFRGKLFEYYRLKVFDSDVYGKLGKKEALQYVLYQQVRFTLAAEVQQVLNKKGAVTKEDIEKIFQKMQGILTPNEGEEKRFESIIQQMKYMDMDDYQHSSDALKLLEPEKLKKNIIWNTSGTEFLQFSMSHPKVIDQEKMPSPDKKSMQETVRSFVRDKEYSFARWKKWTAMPADLAFVKSYAAFLEKPEGKGMDPDGSVRGAIVSLEKNHNWEVVPRYFFDSDENSNIGVNRTKAFQDVLVLLRRHLGQIEKDYDFFHPPVRENIQPNRLAMGKDSRAVSISIDGEYKPEVFVTVGDVKGQGNRVTAEECAGAGKVILDANGKKLGVLTFTREERPVDWRPGRPQVWETFRFDVAGAEAEGQLYFYTKGERGGQSFDRGGTRIDVKRPEQTKLKLRDSGELILDSMFYYNINNAEISKEDWNKAYRAMDRMQFTLRMEDGSTVTGRLTYGWHKNPEGKYVIDPVFVNTSGPKPVIDPNFKVEVVNLKGVDRPGIKLIPQNGLKVKRYEVTQNDTQNMVIAEKEAAPSPAAKPAEAQPVNEKFSIRPDGAFAFPLALLAAPGKTEVLVGEMRRTTVAVTLADGTVIRGKVASLPGKGFTIQDMTVQDPGSEKPVDVASSKFQNLPGGPLTIFVGKDTSGSLNVKLATHPTLKAASYSVENEATGARVRDLKAAPAGPKEASLTVNPEQQIFVPDAKVKVTILGTGGATPESFLLEAGQPVPARLAAMFDCEYKDNPDRGGRKSWYLKRTNAGIDAIQMEYPGHTVNVKFQTPAAPKVEPEKVPGGFTLDTAGVTVPIKQFTVNRLGENKYFGVEADTFSMAVKTTDGKVVKGDVALGKVPEDLASLMYIKREKDPANPAKEIWIINLRSMEVAECLIVRPKSASHIKYVTN